MSRWSHLRSIRTAKFNVQISWTYDDDYECDVQDENGNICAETIANLNDGTWTAYGFRVSVWFAGQMIGESSLWGSIYTGPDEALRERISGYLSGMIAEACTEARRFRADMPSLRKVA